MKAEKANYTVSMMAEYLHVSRSGYYSWLTKDSPHDYWKRLREAVRRVWIKSGCTFGARLVLASLPEEFRDTTLYRVRKTMKELGIQGVVKNTKKKTTIPDKNATKRPDLIKRDFTSPIPTYKLVGDITYLKTGEGWLYLSTVIDLCTRMVVGWATSKRMTADIVVESLERARRRGYVAKNAIFHSDRGSQYTSRLLSNWAKEHQVRLSVGRTGSCYDNAVAESFFGTLKNECYSLRKWKTRIDARNGVIDFIEHRYNRMRPHSTIGYQVPAKVMDAFFERTSPYTRNLKKKNKVKERRVA